MSYKISVGYKYHNEVKAAGHCSGATGTSYFASKLLEIGENAMIRITVTKTGLITCSVVPRKSHPLLAILRDD
jgi:hypothetical protein